MSSVGDKRKRESGSAEKVSKMKQLKAKLLPVNLSTASPGNTPEKVRDHYREVMTAPDGSTGELDLGEEVHVTDKKNQAFKTLFGDDNDDEETNTPATEKNNDTGGGKGFWSFLGIGGRKRRRRKKSRKKRKKSKKRKSRRRRKRGGVPDSNEDDDDEDTITNNMKKMFRNSNEINMPCDTPFGACNTARNKARQEDSDLGQAWVDYHVAFINKNKGNKLRSLGVNRVKQRLRNYYAYFNDLDAETTEAMQKGIIYQPDGIESIIDAVIMAGGRRRKSRKKKRRKSKKRKSRRRRSRRRRR